MEVACPACNKVFRVVDTAAGKRGTCPYCSTFVVVARPSANVAPPAKPSWNPGDVFPVFSGHTGAVNSATFSEGGSIALSAGEDGTVRLWDVESGRETLRLAAHAAGANSAALSLDGTFILSGGVDRTVRLWRVAAGSPVRTFEGHTDAVTSVAFYPLGGYVLSASADGTVRIWQMATGKCARVCKGHKGAVASVTVDSEGKAALSAGADGTIRLWRCDKGKELKRLKGHGGAVHCAIFNRDGGFILSGSEDRTAVLWSVEREKPLVLFKGHSAGVRAVAISRDNATAATGSPDWTAKIWSVDKGAVVRTIEVDDSAITAVALHPDGSHLLSSNSKGVIRLWDTHTGRLVRVFGGTEHSSNTRCPSCGKIFAVGSELAGFEGLCPFCRVRFKATLYAPSRAKDAMKRGLVEMEAGRLDRAVAQFDEAIRRQGDNYEAILNAVVCRNRLGTDLYEMAQYAKALVFLDEGTRLFAGNRAWPLELHVQASQEAYAAAFLAGKICRYHLPDLGRAVAYFRFAQKLHNTLDVQDMLVHTDRGRSPENA